jgi:myo-inositol-1(or 4)-monophosphatase
LYRWIIDPLDGTTSFAHGHPCFSVSIGLQDIKNNEMILGCIYSPTFDELFFAEKGKGATRNGKPIHVSKKAELINSLVASGFPPDRKKCNLQIESNIPYFNATVVEVRGFRRNGSAAIDMVAFFS